MPWEIFEQQASRYEHWYATPRGKRVAQAECALLAWLLTYFPTACSVLEVGCGTGYFTRWLARQGFQVVGLERAPAMLAVLHQRCPTLPVILSDAQWLPFRHAGVDLVLFVTTLEFLEEPGVALAEAARVARQGLLLVVLNRWSLGGLSRRWGSQAHQVLLGQACDYSLVALRTMVQQTAGPRVQQIHWASTLLPLGLWWVRAPVPLGEVLGMAVGLTVPKTNGKT